MDKIKLLQDLYTQIYDFELSKYNFDDVGFDSWRDSVSNELAGSYQLRFDRLEFYSFFDGEYFFQLDIFREAQAIIRDFITKLEVQTQIDKAQIKKLLEARENNLDFEEELAEIICGKDEKFPTHNDISKFFYDLALNHKYDGYPKGEIYNIKKTLLEYSVLTISQVIESGVFKVKYFRDKKYRTKKNEHLSAEEFILEAKKEFQKFIDDSCSASKTLNLSDILDISMNNELLTSIQPNTEDQRLNDRIIEAKNKFWNGDRKTALEKIWSVFERIKTLYNPDLDKKSSAEGLVNEISTDLEFDDINKEFKFLTYVGNNYEIRHFDAGKKSVKPIKDKDTENYLFFRMLALIDVCLKKLPSIDDGSDESKETLEPGSSPG